MDAVKPYYKFISLSVKLIIIAGAFGFIYKKVFNRNDYSELKQAASSMLSEAGYTMVLLVVGLMLFNWGIEAVKWKLLLNKMEELSFLTAVKAVFTGVTVSVFTPNRVGETGGRVFFLQKTDKLKGLLLSFVGSFSQLLVTIIAGTIAGFYYSTSSFSIQPATVAHHLLSAFTLSFILALLLLYFNVALLSRWGRNNERIRYYLDSFAQYTSADLGKVLLLSLLRFAIFSLQFYLLLYCFQVDVAWKEGILMIWLTFFATTLIPAIALADLGIRGSAAIVFIGSLSANHTGIIAASLLLWMINIALPAIAGALFLVRLRFFTRD